MCLPQFFQSSSTHSYEEQHQMYLGFHFLEIGCCSTYHRLLLPFFTSTITDFCSLNTFLSQVSKNHKGCLKLLTSLTCIQPPKSIAKAVFRSYHKHSFQIVSHKQRSCSKMHTNQKDHSLPGFLSQNAQ